MEFWPEFLAGTWGREFIAGAIGGIAGVVAGHPLDTVRVRLQQPHHPLAQHVSAVSEIRRMVRTEGPLALFKGMATPVATIAFQNAITFQAYAILKRALSEPNSDEPLSYGKVALAGCAAGALQTLILTPVDLIKIRLQVQTGAVDGSLAAFRQRQALQLRTATVGGLQSLASMRQSQVGPLDMVRSILRKEGIRGLYQGLTITVLRDAPAHAVYFTTYEYVREKMSPGCRRNGQESVMTMLTAGGLAGVLSWVVCYPLDVIKSRVQAQDPANPRYSGIVDCLRKSVRDEGYPVLFRGLGTAVARAFIVNGAIFTAYETALRFLSQPPQTNNLGGPQMSRRD